jgi:hypothetical protein
LGGLVESVSPRKELKENVRYLLAKFRRKKKKKFP